ncbi:MAG: ATP synthase F1 subunit delta [Atopobiaceae bacterium]|jgi:F-type H+-transporting ATPase subunit delta|nr:ATP synthase F1 subunit delta [Atopobiaceae bacterium]MCI2173556.1 ATP synthase F1 subunit delta [Atopobiaceae bacterium]MCI2207802.1 ATP synthase F1 subunit delta [Atopobiaceae bacterium]
MASSRIEQKKVETYARTLLEAARTEGREAREATDLAAAAALPSEIMDMLSVMRDRDDLGLLGKVSAKYQDILESEGDTVAVEVTTAIELDDELRKTITDKLEADLGTTVFLIEKVDPSIIGGIIISARGERRDASVRAQLTNARQVLAQTSLGGE